MRSVPLTILVLLASAVPAAAAPHWGDPVPFTGAPPVNAALGVTGDGTRIVAWTEPGGQIRARVGDGPTVVLGNASGVLPQIATGGSGHGVVAWTDLSQSFTATVDQGVLGAPEVAAPGQLEAVRMNAAGDTAVAATVHTSEGPYGSSAPQLAFRPAGGPFGAPVSPGTFVNFDGDVNGFALSPAGESLLLLHGGNIAMPGPLDLYSRTADGPLSDPYRLGDTLEFGTRIGVDGRGRAVVLSRSSPFTGPVASIRSPDGAWATVPAVLPQDQALSTALATSAAGDIVLAEPGPGFEGHNVAPPLPPSAPRVVTGSLDTQQFSAPVQLAGGRGAGFALAGGPDGTTVIAYEDKDANQIRVVRRQGTGPFTAAQPAVCGETGPTAAAMAGDGTTTLLVGATTITETGGTDTPTCPPRELRGRITYAPAVPVAGRPVTITVHRFHGTGTYATSATFVRGRDRVPMRLRGSEATLRYTFPKAGAAIGWTITGPARSPVSGAPARLVRHVTVAVRPRRR